MNQQTLRLIIMAFSSVPSVSSLDIEIHVADLADGNTLPETLGNPQKSTDSYLLKTVSPLDSPLRWWITQCVAAWPDQCSCSHRPFRSFRLCGGGHFFSNSNRLRAGWKVLNQLYGRCGIDYLGLGARSSMCRPTVSWRGRGGWEEKGVLSWLKTWPPDWRSSSYFSVSFSKRRGEIICQTAVTRSDAVFD